MALFLIIDMVSLKNNQIITNEYNIALSKLPNKTL